MEQVPAKFCPRCGTAIHAPEVGAQPTCPRGHFTWYADPKLAVGVLVAREGKLLLVRRNHTPALGRWAFPSGFVDAGEVIEEAAVREVFEETGIKVQIDGLIGVYSEAGNSVVFVAYAGSATGGDAVAGPEAFEVGWFTPDQLPELSFTHDSRIVTEWAERFAASG
jgi:ADP-ribose pyrophosphatase YjhB (NUDIX family)